MKTELVQRVVEHHTQNDHLKKFEVSQKKIIKLDLTMFLISFFSVIILSFTF